MLKRCSASEILAEPRRTSPYLRPWNLPIKLINPSAYLVWQGAYTGITNGAESPPGPLSAQFFRFSIHHAKDLIHWLCMYVIVQYTTLIWTDCEWIVEARLIDLIDLRFDRFDRCIVWQFDKLIERLIDWKIDRFDKFDRFDRLIDW